MLVWLNGRVVDARAARVSALDRGLLHGDGVYDTWRTYGGRPFMLEAHLRRLAGAARRLGLPAPGAAATWALRTRRLLWRAGLADGAARLTITRGTAGLGPLPHGRGRTLLLTVRPLPANLRAQQRDGVTVILLPFPRDAAPGWGDVKLVGHASAVVGRMLAARRNAAEGLYVSPNGHVTEGTSSNIFLLEDRTLVTPPADGAILRGVTRDLVIRLARRAGVAVREAAIDAGRLLAADEAFITASTIEVMPIVRVDGRRVARGRVGVVTRELQAAYGALVRRSGIDGPTIPR